MGIFNLPYDAFLFYSHKGNLDYIFCEVWTQNSIANLQVNKKNYELHLQIAVRIDFTVFPFLLTTLFCITNVFIVIRPKDFYIYHIQVINYSIYWKIKIPNFKIHYDSKLE